MTIDEDSTQAMNPGRSPAGGGSPAPGPGDVFSLHPGVPATFEARPPTDDALPGRGRPMPESRRGSRAGSGFVLVAAMLLAVAGAAFAVGRTSAPASAAGGSGSFGNGAAGPRASGDLGQAGTGGSTTLSGTIVDVTSDHLTLELASGQTVQVALDSSTAYHAQTAASDTDLAQGSSVTVRVAGGVPTASGSPGAVPSGAAASGAPVASGSTSRSLTAQDVTITGN